MNPSPACLGRALLLRGRNLAPTTPVPNLPFAFAPASHPVLQQEIASAATNRTISDGNFNDCPSGDAAAACRRPCFSDDIFSLVFTMFGMDDSEICKAFIITIVHGSACSVSRHVVSSLCFLHFPDGRPTQGPNSAAWRHLGSWSSIQSHIGLLLRREYGHGAVQDPTVVRTPTDSQFDTRNGG